MRYVTYSYFRFKIEQIRQQRQSVFGMQVMQVEPILNGTRLS